MLRMAFDLLYCSAEQVEHLEHCIDLKKIYTFND